MRNTKAALVIATPAQLNELFRGRRKAQKLSQAQLAEKIGLTQSGYSKLEADPGAMPLERLLIVARVLGFELVLRDRTTAESEW
jgi:HTH-type transcriptional regulator / antitoxin HipB